MSPVMEKHVLQTPGPCPTIETSRLILRPHRMSDADAIAQSLSDFAISRMLTRVPLPFHRQDAIDWLSQSTSALSKDWSLAITTGDDTHIGVVSIELRHGLWNMGYWLNRYYWGKGHMSEAAYAVTERFFMRMPEVTLHSGAFADNAASLRIQEKLGFAITRTDTLYSIARGIASPHIETKLAQAGFRRP